MGNLYRADPSNFFVDDATGLVHYKTGERNLTQLASTNVDCTFAGVARRLVVESAATRTLTALNSGGCYINILGSGTATYTLPAATALAGAFYTFVLGATGGQLQVNPAGTDTISIKASEGGANVLTAGGTGIKNTTATQVLNDTITLVSNGVSKWYAISQSGTWATQ